MKAPPSVSSTCGSCSPERRRSRNRSISPPMTAMAAALVSAATQKLKPRASIVTPKYAPSMKNEPCIRLGMRIRPKISEKPEESRNRRPPSATLLTAKVSQRVIQVDLVHANPLPLTGGVEGGEQAGA